MSADFIHLRVHTPYSLLEGAVKIPDLVELARRQGMPALAVTDTGNMFGALEFSAKCAEAGLQPIIGLLLALRDGTEAHNAAPERILLLAQNEAGYGNLLKLVSRSYLETDPGDTAQVSWDVLGEHSAGLIALTGGPTGPINPLIVGGQLDKARERIVALQGIFPNRLYVELQRHELAAERQAEAGLVEMAYAFDLPLVATNDVMFKDVAMHQAHDALMCIAGGTTVNQTERRRASPQQYFKSAEEMCHRFADLPEAVANTLVIARRCAVMSPGRAPILPRFPAADGISEADELRRQAREGLQERLAAYVLTDDMAADERERIAGEYRERLEYELDVIADMEFPGYFLIVADFIKWAKKQAIPVGPGRGSGAGSVVAWSLTITDLDPIRFGLLFERFLNPERVSMPDFDIDFCQDRRDEVIRYVQGRYGHDQVAQIITFGTLQARAAVRDVGRVLEMPYGQVDRLAKLVPANPANPVKLKDAIAGEPQLQEARDNDEQVARLLDIALKLEGLYRHASTHAAGVVIGDRPLDELVPLYRDPRSDMPVTQFHMKDVEKAGLVKLDFLGLKTLTVLQVAVRYLAESGIEIDLLDLPLDDKATYEILGRGESVGIFQLEGQGMRDALRQLKADKIEDIIAMVALYRPGPMDNIPSFIARKHGREKVDTLDPKLEEVLTETYGVIIYQEQVMEIAKILSGYSLGDADLLRRAMGKKIKAEMDAQRERFVSGAVERGLAETKASDIFDLVAKFAGYGFNKSHAAAYALVAYQTAYLKANYPVEFLAASMTLDMGNTDKLNIFKQELNRQGIELLPPDINKSGVDFTVERLGDGTKAVRYALAAIKNVGAQAMADLIRERDENGAFANLFDFAGRIDGRIMNKRQVENLARAGAFDHLEANRAKVVGNVELLVRFNAVVTEERESQQESLFGGDSGGEGPVTPELAEVEEWLPSDRLREEFEAIGFHLTAHPLEPYQEALERMGVVTFAEAEEQAVQHGASVFKLAGVPVSRRERTSGSGSRFAFAVISDTSGSHEIVLFSEVLAASRPLLDDQQPVLIDASARVDGDAVKFSANRLEPLDQAAAGASAAFRVRLADTAALVRLRNFLSEARSGRGRIVLVMDRGPRRVEVALPDGYSLSPGLRNSIEAMSGVAEVLDEDRLNEGWARARSNHMSLATPGAAR